MNALAWNCRGVGNRRTVQEVLALSKANIPKLVFLCETRQAANKVEKMKWRLGLKGFCGVSSDGFSGGLALFWDESLQVSLLDSCARYIDVMIRDNATGVQWRGTFVYGEPRVENRYLMWEHLVRLKGVSNEPWFVCGDFNEAAWQHEHFSSTSQGEAQMTAFRDALLDCELWDLGFSGLPFTYNNGRLGLANVRVRLDRACADEAWGELFLFARVQHLISSRSDHLPLLIHLLPEDSQRRCPIPRYEIMWEREPSLPDIISDLGQG